MYTVTFLKFPLEILAKNLHNVHDAIADSGAPGCGSVGISCTRVPPTRLYAESPYDGWLGSQSSGSTYYYRCNPCYRGEPQITCENGEWVNPAGECFRKHFKCISIYPDFKMMFPIQADRLKI